MPRKSDVDKSAHRAEIIEMLRAGCSAARVRTHLIARHADKRQVPSVDSIRRYRSAHLPMGAVLSAYLVKQELRFPRGNVNVLEMLDNMLLMQEERIARMWRRELETGEESHGLNRAIGVAREFLRDRHRIAREIDLGEQAHGRPALEVRNTVT